MSMVELRRGKGQYYNRIMLHCYITYQVEYPTYTIAIKLSIFLYELDFHSNEK